MSDGVKEFQGQYRWLSNFWPAVVLFEEQAWPTVEHAYQAAKCANSKYRAELLAIPAEAAGRAKKRGRGMEGDRKAWQQRSLPIMLGLLRQKFAQEPFRSKLLAIEGEIVEGNRWHDNFFGVCLCGCGKGENNLGKLIMQVREELRCK